MARDAARRFRVHIGLRNIKTTLSVLICALFYHFTGFDGVMIATVAAIICMQDSVEKSLKNGKNRMLSIGIGVVIAILFRYINRYFANPYLAIISVGAGIMFLIMICNLLKRNSAIVMGCVVFLSIMLGGGDIDIFEYSVSQLLHSFLGVSVAVLVNHFLLNPAKKDPGGIVKGEAADAASDTATVAEEDDELDDQDEAEEE